MPYERQAEDVVAAPSGHVDLHNAANMVVNEHSDYIEALPADEIVIRVSEPPPVVFQSSTGDDSFDGRWDRPKLLISAALAAIPTGGEVKLGGGNLLVGSEAPFTLSSDQKVTGRGMATQLVSNPATGFPVDARMFDVAGVVQGVQLRDFWIRSAGGLGTGYRLLGSISSSRFNVVDGVKVSSAKQRCAVIEGAKTHVLNSDLQIISTGQSSDSRCLEVVGNDNYFHNVWCSGSPKEAVVYNDGANRYDGFHPFCNLIDDGVGPFPVGIKWLSGGGAITNSYLDWVRQNATILIAPPTGKTITRLQINNNWGIADTYNTAAPAVQTDNLWPWIKVDLTGGGTLRALQVEGNIVGWSGATKRGARFIDLPASGVHSTVIGNSAEYCVEMWNNEPTIHFGNSFEDGS